MYSFKSIRQWYKKVANLDKHWKESKREDKRLRDKTEDEKRKNKWRRIKKMGIVMKKEVEKQ